MLRSQKLVGATLGALCVLSVSAARAQVLQIDGQDARWVAMKPSAPALADVGRHPPSSESPAFTQAVAAAGPIQWQASVANLAAKYDISPALLEAVVWQESRWRLTATSAAGAHGLAQLMPGTARDLGVDIRDPSANLDGGARYLRMQLDTFGGDVEKALAAYNAGPARVDRAGGVPNIPETKAYVAAIMARMSDSVRR